MVSVPEENSERMEVVPANEDKKDKSEKEDLPSNSFFVVAGTEEAILLDGKKGENVLVEKSFVEEPFTENNKKENENDVVDSLVEQSLVVVGAENNEKTLWMVSFFFFFFFFFSVFSFIYSLLLSFFLFNLHYPSFSFVSQFSYLLFLKTPNTVQHSCPLKMPVEKFSVQLPISENIPKVKKFVSFFMI
jgi:hypothetical protein